MAERKLARFHRLFERCAEVLVAGLLLVESREHRLDGAVRPAPVVITSP